MPSKAIQEALEKFKREHIHGEVEVTHDRASSLGRPYVLKCKFCGTFTKTLLDREDTRPG